MIIWRWLRQWLWKLGGLYFFSFNDFTIISGGRRQIARKKAFVIEQIDNLIEKDLDASETIDLRI
jgi:hypothetical protein